MAQIYGPKIVTQGLVLSLDASDVNSYPAPIIVSVQAYSVYGGGLRSANYTVQFSDDNSTWTTAFTGIMSNNSSCGIITGTGIGSGTYGRHRYWRYVEGSAVVSHHPRVSRIDLIDINGTVRNLVTYTSDNCSDSGTYIVGTVSADLGGTTWYNISSAGSNGTLTNGPLFDVANAGSLYYDGTNDYVSVTCAASTIRAYNSSTEFVIKLPLYSGGQRAILSYRSANTMYVGKGSGGIFVYYNTLNNPAYTVGNITDGSIVHVVILCNADGNLLSTYINGTLAGSVTRTGWSATYNNTLVLGYDDGGTNEYMLGNMYLFKHYNRVLSGTEIAQNYTVIKSRFGLA